MTAGKDNAALARTIVDANQYMTLGTADASGTPWATPVWFASEGYRELFWVSVPEARHSRNIAVRPEIGLVIFDSHVPIGTGQAVYMEARAGEVADTDVDRGIGIFSRATQAAGGAGWTREDVAPGARHRLYRALADEQFVLDGRDVRIPVTI